MKSTCWRRSNRSHFEPNHDITHIKSLSSGTTSESLGSLVLGLGSRLGVLSTGLDLSSTLGFLTDGDDGFKEDTLVSELIALNLVVHVMVLADGDLLLIAVLAEHSTLRSHAVDPQSLGWRAGLASAVSLTSTGVTAETFGGLVLSEATTRDCVFVVLVDELGRNDLSDGRSALGTNNQVLFAGDNCDFAFAAAEDIGGETSLQGEVMFFTSFSHIVSKEKVWNISCAGYIITSIVDHFSPRS